jgi:hypothetical protein
VLRCNSVKNGAWRSLVARYFGVVEVVGSNPAAPIEFQRLGKGFGLYPVFSCWGLLGLVGAVWRLLMGAFMGAFLLRKMVGVAADLVSVQAANGSLCICIWGVSVLKLGRLGREGGKSRC